ncbi:hypothetical protein L228DRAFT_248993 [Xylona heveae TC161]|uniref:BZIP domain-containing protein n=1 Tax=Xylona heveae (strain CBS 132557 / TC161) TaxID=1328760 RepID=A0A165FP13_XYLHT|nr:hypothetical protein L228DRAFT_248993 [Xylona heveae TC161]KZF21210.1 hypothetical protein L228DRAFT_248993 [Xylona heveae TC161]
MQSSMQPAIAPAPHAMQNTAQDNAAEISLREHLLAQVHSPQPGTHHLDNIGSGSSMSPHDHNIDPAIAGPGLQPSPGGEAPGAGDLSDEAAANAAAAAELKKAGGKRELSTSKRAAQNRAAQVRNIDDKTNAIIFFLFQVPGFPVPSKSRKVWSQKVSPFCKCSCLEECARKSCILSSSEKKERLLELFLDSCSRSARSCFVTSLSSIPSSHYNTKIIPSILRHHGAYVRTIH